MHVARRVERPHQRRAARACDVVAGSAMAERRDADLAARLLLAADVDAATPDRRRPARSPAPARCRARRARATRSRTSSRTAAATALPSIVRPTRALPAVQTRSSGATPGRGKSRRPRCARVLRMIVGVPREIKAEESRVALTPSGVGAFVAHGHRVLVEHGAGAASHLPDRAVSRRRRHARRRAAGLGRRRAGPEGEGAAAVGVSRCCAPT